jgi:hypothetical protein
MRYIGIDPGEVWVGFAVLDVLDRDVLYTSCGVLDLEARGFTPLVKEIRRWLPAYVAGEEFRSRPMGHRTWSKEETARLLGALQFAVEESGSTWRTAEAGNPNVDLPKLGWEGWLENWSTQWPRVHSAPWNHARAAWRALGMVLLRETEIEDGEWLLGRLAMMLNFKMSSARMVTLREKHEREVIAPTAVWRLP